MRIELRRKPIPEAETATPKPEEQAPALDVVAPIVEERVEAVQPTPTSTELAAQLAAIQAQLDAAKRREKLEQEQAAAAARARSAADGKRLLGVFLPKLQRHLAEVDRVQRTYGHILKDMARSCAADQDAQVRLKISAINGAAGPLGAKLGEARATLEAALKGATKALEHHAAHVHDQARVLAEAALAINIISLETEAKSLIQLKTELRGGTLDYSPTTPDHLPGAYAPPAHTHTVADFGGSLTERF